MPPFLPETFRWFEGLEKDNSKAYFDRTRATYDAAVKGALQSVFESLLPRFPGTIKLFRQNRDIRFSADKSPYKTMTYGVIRDRPGSHSGLYLSISSRGMSAGTGCYDMAKDQLARYRTAVDDPKRGSALQDAIEACEAAGLTVDSERLATVPRGFAKDHPRRDLLARTSLIAHRRWDPAATLALPSPADPVAETWEECEPLIRWLDEHVGPSAEKG